MVLDIGTRRVIGGSFRETLEATLVTTALDMALGSRSVNAGLICHSDRGSQYGSEDVQAMIERYRLRGSMSRKGNCWDNAVVERSRLIQLLVERVVCSAESNIQVVSLTAGSPDLGS